MDTFFSVSQKKLQQFSNEPQQLARSQRKIPALLTHQFINCGPSLFFRLSLKVFSQVDGKDSEKSSSEKETEIKTETDSGEPKKSEDESKPETARDRVIKDGQIQVKNGALINFSPKSGIVFNRT